jgi:hypothetical protein
MIGTPWVGRIVWSVVLVGMPLIILSEYSLSLESYRLWKYGVAKRALVVSLDHADWVFRGGTTYWYRVNMDGKEITAPFRVRLPEGKFVPLLVLPEKANEPALGSRTSSFFEIYSYSMGGKVIGALSLMMSVFVVCWSPMLIRQIWIKRRSFFAY